MRAMRIGGWLAVVATVWLGSLYAGPTQAQPTGQAQPGGPAPLPPAKQKGPGGAPDLPSQADIDLVKALRGGGHAIVMRHAPADPDRADSTPLNFRNIRNQQPLTEAGSSAARTFGDWLRAIGVPIGEVLTSRFHRAIQTAVLAGFRDAKPVTELTEGSLVTSPNEQRRRANALKQLLAAPLPPGRNRLLVSHRAVISQAFGKEWFDVREGEASVFKIDNGAFTLVARLQLGDWARLGRAVPQER
jgi:broad specificity phosphatase PhoE